MVAPLIIGGAIAAGSSLLGGLMDKSNNYSQWKRDADFQRELGKNRIQWAVQDAIKAGLHPTVAAGVQPYSGGVASRPSGMGNAISGAGQSIAEALLQKKNAELIDAQIRNMDAQTDVIKGQHISAGSLNPEQPPQPVKTFPLVEPEVMKWEEVGSPLSQKTYTNLDRMLNKLPLKHEEREALKEGLGEEGADILISAINGSALAKDALARKLANKAHRTRQLSSRFEKSLKSFLFHLDRRNKGKHYQPY